MIAVSVYIASVVAVNAAVSALGMASVFGVAVPWGLPLIGFVFVFRDYAQRQIGHKVVFAMLAATVISYFMSPEVALASAAAFLVSETVDWIVYTLTKRPLSERVLYSSAVATPLDSIVFLALLPFPGALSAEGVAILTAFKMSAALAWFAGLKLREA